jgi:predicted metalloprotease with PDZ domain
VGRLLCLFLCASALFAQRPIVQRQVRYELRFPHAAHHEAEVRVTFLNVPGSTLEVVMSRSSPGRYALHEFAKNVYNFRASDGQGRSLRVTQPNPSQWNVEGVQGAAVVEYTLFGDRTDGTYTAIDLTHAHLNTPAALVWARGFERAPVSVHFDAPNGLAWKPATQLAPQSDGSWTAPGRDMLMDAPIELSAHSLKKWTVDGHKFRLALHHQGSEEEASAFAHLCKAVVTEEEGVFGAFPKFDNEEYTFILDLLPYSSGDGMEHRDSTVITGPWALKTAPQNALGIVAHEFFHCWNVRRIRPRSLEPFDFERANMSGELWFAEGFTSYYATLSLRRAGLSSLQDFAGSMGRAVSAVLTDPGRTVFNVTDMSRRAPFVDAATANDPDNTANTFISYYTYGQALGLGIDLAIRARFPGKSLDDWMRTMWREHPDVEKPYTLPDLEKTLGEITDPAFAREIFERHIYGKEPMDYAALLSRAGLLLRSVEPVKLWLGAPQLNFSNEGAAITAPVLRESPLYDAGLDLGDRITEWDGRKLANQKELEDWLGQHKPGDRVALNVEGRAGTRKVDVTLVRSPSLQVVPFEQAGRDLSLDQSEFRREWLRSRAVRPLPKVWKYCPECHRKLPFEYAHCPSDGHDLRITPDAR